MQRIIPYPFLLITAILLDRMAIASTQIGTGQSLRTLFLLLLLTAITSFVIQYFARAGITPTSLS